LVTGDHITSVHDNMLGIEGGKDVLVLNDAYSELKVAYPMPDKSAASTMMAIQHFKGNREIIRFYSDRSGEIERALRVLHITPDTSQPGVPQNNAVAERLVQDVFERDLHFPLKGRPTSVLLGICLPTLLPHGECYCSAKVEYS
ncbi:MAG: hypothetical protein ACKPKO_31420, partial [Candidatus Fonsibacter sp.]